MFLLAFSISGIDASKVLAIMASVFAILQAAKKAFPALSGWYAVAINVAISVIGMLVVIPPDKLFSLETLTTAALALIAALGAAGIHGTYTNVINPPEPVVIPSMTTSTQVSAPASSTTTSKDPFNV